MWGYQDDDDDFPGARGRSPPPPVVAFSSDQGDGGDVDDGSGSSRMGPVDREHFYSVKVTHGTGDGNYVVSAAHFGIRVAAVV